MASASFLRCVPVRFAHSASGPEPFKTVGIVGLGLMGHGIAQVTAAAGGMKVVAYDSSPAQLEKGLGMIRSSATSIAQKAVAKGQLPDAAAAEKAVAATLGNITAASDMAALSACDLVIEAGPEDADLKAALYKKLAGVLPPSTVLASNTSGLEIGWLASQYGRMEAVVGLHYFNPVQIMRLVEVVGTPSTPKPLIDRLFAFAERQGKKPVLAADTPGFIVNRLLVPYLAQAIAMHDRGVATVSDIDTAMCLGASHPMGPLHLADYVGLDTCLFILQNWSKKYPGEAAFFVPEGLKKKVAEGKLGRKTGVGYYKWKGNAVLGPA